MADTKISGLAAVTSALSTDEFVLARSGTTKKIAASDLFVGYTPIANIDLTASQTFTSIPGNFSDLVVKVFGRGTQAAATVVANLVFNNDTGANYESNLINNSNNSGGFAATASQTEAVLSVFPAASATANRAGVSIVEILEYANTSFHKIMHAESQTIYGAAASNYVTQIRGIQWRSTAAITEIDITLSAGAWAAGSVARLYGIA